MNYAIEHEQEADGRWLAEVVAYGRTEEEAISRVEALALRVLADRIKNGETQGRAFSVSFAAA
ncbi:MAG: type II toxin-antitoxin system HicB family antitoxin [Nitrospirae bacterium]|nr:type II toxin-antitoxin system HicB family antitoxin [Magnetococcales bacterium]